MYLIESTFFEEMHFPRPYRLIRIHFSPCKIQRDGKEIRMVNRHVRHLGT